MFSITTSVGRTIAYSALVNHANAGIHIITNSVIVFISVASSTANAKDIDV